MIWPNFLEPIWSALFLLLVPLIIFYFLKLRRPRLDVASLALWRSVINDQRVNSPFQRFKRNLLLLFQVLMLTLLILAAMRPFIPSGTDRAEYIPVLIDCSASMGALDKPGGQTRLELAKEEVARLIDNLLPGQKLSLISVSNTARSLCEFSDNRRVLHAALEKAVVQHTSSRLEDGLRMAQALSLTNSVETVFLYTDGNVPAIVNFDLPFQLNYQKLDVGGPNVGITAVNAQRTRDKWDVFVKLDAKEDSTITTTVEMWRDGVLEGSEIVTVVGKSSQRVVFPLSDQSASSIEIRIKPDGFDSLELDNNAWLDLPVTRDLTVFCPITLTTFRQALLDLEGVSLYPDEEGNGTLDNYDLVITDSPDQAGLDTRMSLLIGIVPEDLRELVELTDKIAEIVDWQRSAPLLQYVSLKEVMIGDEPRRRAGMEDQEFENRGYEILAQGRAGPLVVHKSDRGKEVYALLFHTDRSTLTIRVGFPVLVKNSLDEARRQAGLSEAQSHPTGLLATRRLTPETEFTVVNPDGTTTQQKSAIDGTLTGIPAPMMGRYSIQADGKEVAHAGVSLQSVTETELVDVATLQMKEVKVGRAEARIKTDRPLWPWLALAGFVFLLTEWWLFQKRPSGMPA